ncbi:hypothetical protein [Herbaspirillum sp. 1130]|uniref:hypothetical protein n=1 Tax=Herbaspirillum sp. 1130 TaxID=2806562 RepID=UPI001AE54C50|nr:hypothetical protein [Herbaspirillum sp. 1130]
MADRPLGAGEKKRPALLQAAFFSGADGRNQTVDLLIANLPAELYKSIDQVGEISLRNSKSRRPTTPISTPSISNCVANFSCWNANVIADPDKVCHVRNRVEADHKNYHGEKIENSHTLHGLCRCSAFGVVRCCVGAEG